jgi:NADP-dependent 3-hydroxy acid dehydrogenase YdfG
VHALTEALRLELRQANSRIRISAISPGYVETEFAAKYHRSPERAEEVYGQFTVLQPEDVARSVAYVLSQPEHVQVHDLLIRPTEQFS